MGGLRMLTYGRDWWVARRGTGKVHTCVLRTMIGDDWATYRSLCGRRFDHEEIYETEEQVNKDYEGCQQCEDRMQ